jgi:hypothetical protein
MKMILINPYLQTIDEINWKVEWDYTEIYKLIDCRTFAWIDLDNKGNGMYVDDEGLLSLKRDDDNELEQQFFRVIDSYGYEHTIAGSALVLSTDKMTGETIGTDLDVEYIKLQIDFLDKNDNKLLGGENNENR